MLTSKSRLLTSKSEMLTSKSLFLTSKSEMLTSKSLFLTSKSEMLTRKSNFLITDVDLSTTSARGRAKPCTRWFHLAVFTISYEKEGRKRILSGFEPRSSTVIRSIVPQLLRCPESERNARDEFVPDGTHARLAGHDHSATDGKSEEQGQSQRGHLDPEGLHIFIDIHGERY